MTDKDKAKAKTNKLNGIIESMRAIVFPGDYGLGTERSSIAEDDKAAWEEMGRLLNRLEAAMRFSLQEVAQSAAIAERLEELKDGDYSEVEGFLEWLETLVKEQTIENGGKPVNAYEVELTGGRTVLYLNSRRTGSRDHEVVVAELRQLKDVRRTHYIGRYQGVKEVR